MIAYPIQHIATTAGSIPSVEAGKMATRSKLNKLTCKGCISQSTAEARVSPFYLFSAKIHPLPSAGPRNRVFHHCSLSLASTSNIDLEQISFHSAYLGSQMSLVHIDPTFLFYILLRPFLRLGKIYMLVIFYNKYSFRKGIIKGTIHPKSDVGFCHR